MKNRLPDILAGLSIIIAILLLFHQRLIHHYWFSRQAALHHESFEVFFLALAIGLLLGKYLGRCRD
jgi:hypothetical protein